MLKKLFGFDPTKTTVRTEILAGITTFLTMSYILAINPAMFGELNMPAGAVFTSTALAAIVGTLVMAVWAKLPFGLAPGIGLFIAFIGLQNAGVIVNNESTLVELGTITSGSALLSFIGILITGFLYIKNVRGAMLVGILATTTYVESASGVAQGGRTGLTAFTIACCFAVSLFFSPLFLSIPSAAIAPVLILVGLMMLEPGMISYVLINLVCGNFKKLTPTMYILATLFILKYIFI